MEIGVKDGKIFRTKPSTHQHLLFHHGFCWWEQQTLPRRNSSPRRKEVERFQLAEQRRERRMLQNKVDAR